MLPRDAAVTRNRLDALYSRLVSERSSFDAHWRDVADFLFPRRVRINQPGDRNKGDRRNQNIINSTARFASRTLQSGMHAGLTSPARPWLRITVPDKQLAKRPAVRAWLQEVTNQLLQVFALSNTYNALPTVYGDMGIFGTAAMGLMEDRKDLLRCYNYPIGSYVLGRDARGLVSIFGRELELTVLQVVEEYGLKADGYTIDWSKLSPTVKALWERSDYESPVTVRWMVLTNPHFNPELAEARFKRFRSCHWETGNTEPVFLRESGYDEFPILAPRWEVTGEDSYGTDCPGMMAHGDNRQLQGMEKAHGKAVQKSVDPPLQGPASLRTQKTSMLPGDITYVDVREGMQGLKAVHEIGLNLQHLGLNLEKVEYRIKRAFYEDLFLMLATQDPYRGSAPPTAREVDERHEEKLLALGPVLERTNDELLDPMVDRTFNILLRNGLIPDPPPEIQGSRMQPEYISILAQAQQLVGVVSQDRFLSTLVPLVEVFPEAKAKVKINRIIDNYVEMLGVDVEAIRTDGEADALVQEAAAQQQASLEAEQAKNVAQAMKAGSEADMGGDTALNRIVGNAATV